MEFAFKRCGRYRRRTRRLMETSRVLHTQGGDVHAQRASRSAWLERRRLSVSVPVFGTLSRVVFNTMNANSSGARLRCVGGELPAISGHEELPPAPAGEAR